MRAYRRGVASRCGPAEPSRARSRPTAPPVTTSAHPRTRLRARRPGPVVDAALEDALAGLLPRLAALHPALVPVTDHLAAFLAGGKRVRPTLLLLGHAAAAGATATRCSVRRSRSSCCTPARCSTTTSSTAPRRDGGGRRCTTPSPTTTAPPGGRATRSAYGEAVAILLGDLAFVQADELFLERRRPGRARCSPGFRRFTVLREEVMAGQYLDLHAATARLTDRDLALTHRDAEVGAVLGRAAARDRRAARRRRPPTWSTGSARVGDPLGRAFQVRDDLLGVFGEEAVTGKSAASDLAEGKRTLLIAEAAARLGDDDRARLEAGLGDPDLSRAEAGALRDLLDACGARAACERYVDVRGRRRARRRSTARPRRRRRRRARVGGASARRPSPAALTRRSQASVGSAVSAAWGRGAERRVLFEALLDRGEDGGEQHVSTTAMSSTSSRIRDGARHVVGSGRGGPRRSRVRRRCRRDRPRVGVVGRADQLTPGDQPLRRR